MKYRRLFLLIVALMAASTVPSHARQAFGESRHAYPSDSPVAATYFLDRTQQLDGNIASVQFRHARSAFMYVMVPDEHGQMQRWAAEWRSARQLRRHGVARWTLRPGNRVMLTGNPSRQADDHRLLIQSIVRPLDGWRWGWTEWFE